MCSKDNSGESCRFPLEFLRHVLGGRERLLGATKWRRKPRLSSQYFLTILPGDDGHRVTYEWGRKYRLSSELLILRREVRLLFFPICSYFLKLFSFQAAFFLILWLQRASISKTFLVSVFGAFCLLQNSSFSSTFVTKLNLVSLPILNKANLLTLGCGEKSTASGVADWNKQTNKKPCNLKVESFIYLVGFVRTSSLGESITSKPKRTVSKEIGAGTKVFSKGQVVWISKRLLLIKEK